MNSDYWREKWDQSAKINTDIPSISGWGDRTFYEMLFSLNDIGKKMKLAKDDRLLDVGCGAGLFEIAFSNWIHEIIGCDYSREMVKHAYKFSKNFNNVFINQCDINHLPFKGGSFDKILVNSVIQYLNTPNDVIDAITELKRVAKRDAIILLSLIPSATTKEEYIEGYYRLGFTPEDIQEKILQNSRIQWFFPLELKEELQNLDFSNVSITYPVNSFQKKYYFDIIIEK